MPKKNTKNKRKTKKRSYKLLGTPYNDITKIPDKIKFDIAVKYANRIMQQDKEFPKQKKKIGGGKVTRKRKKVKRNTTINNKLPFVKGQIVRVKWPYYNKNNKKFNIWVLAKIKKSISKTSNKWYEVQWLGTRGPNSTINIDTYPIISEDEYEKSGARILNQLKKGGYKKYTKKRKTKRGNGKFSKKKPQSKPKGKKKSKRFARKTPPIKNWNNKNTQARYLRKQERNARIAREIIDREMQKPIVIKARDIIKLYRIARNNNNAILKAYHYILILGMITALTVGTSKDGKTQASSEHASMPIPGITDDATALEWQIGTNPNYDFENSFIQKLDAETRKKYLLGKKRLEKEEKKKKEK